MVISSPVPSNNHNDHDPARGDETVTLTKTQLRAILQTLAKDSGTASDEGILSLEREVSRQRHQSLPSLKTDLIEEDPLASNGQDNSAFTSSQLSRGETPVHLPNFPSLQDLCKPPASRTSNTTYTSNLSKVERKRLQWEREKAEMQEWNPWGKPGAGAPLRNNFYSVSNNRQIDGEEEGLSVNGHQTRAIQYRSPAHLARRDDKLPYGRRTATDEDQAERRQRALQYQREIELQVEEKRRRQREERERQIREEQQEEAKLALERERLQSEYNLEQERLRLKEEQKQKKQELLISAVKKAQASAEAARRVSKQKKASPGVQSPPSDPSTDALPLEEEPAVAGSLVTLPLSPPPPPLSQNRRECAVQAALAETCRCIHSYVENRVLTPSKLRIQSRLSCCRHHHGRDFGTQTDSAILDSLSPLIRDDSTTSEESSSESLAPERLSRVQPFRPPRMSELQPCQSPTTTPTQNGFRRKKLQELRKQHWQREMANQRLFLSADHPSDADNSMDPELPHSPPSPLRDHPRTSSPPVPALQRKLGLVPNRPLQPRDHSLEDRPQSPPVPALRRKLEASLATTNSAPSVFPQPSPQSLRRQWSRSSEHLPTSAQQLDHHRCSLPTMDSSSTSTSSSSASSTNPSTMRRRWRSQETFLIPDNFPTDSNNVAVVAPTQANSPQCRSASVGTRRRWDTESHYSATEDDPNKNSKPPTPDPLVHPELVTGRPTARQDRILQQLTDLRQGLVKKQKELESMLHPPPS